MEMTAKIDVTKLRHPSEDYITSQRFPTIWCAGCSIGTNLQAIIRGLNKAGLDFDRELVLISGIGCTGRASGYVAADGFHTTHGRAIPFAAGVKHSKPELGVVVFSGDGDLLSIGGNHFIHAARRDTNITVICNNNGTYGLTGGQESATSFLGTKTPSTFGSVKDKPFNLVDLAIGAGARYVARYTSAHYKKIPNIVRDAVRHNGFSFIDLVSGCPALYGKRNGFPSGDLVMKKFLEASVEIKQQEDGSHMLYENTLIHFDAENTYTRIPVGVFVNERIDKRRIE